MPAALQDRSNNGDCIAVIRVEHADLKLADYFIDLVKPFRLPPGSVVIISSATLRSLQGVWRSMPLTWWRLKAGLQQVLVETWIWCQDLPSWCREQKTRL